jgi:hypothetical protein
MRAVILATALAGMTLAVPAAVAAGPIERACLSSERASGNRALCGCIQQAANRTLTARDQRAAARFFRDPDRAQQVRMSRRESDRAFWQRYENFGSFAEVSCVSS